LSRQIKAGTIELEVVPMGTLAERYRAAAAGVRRFIFPPVPVRLSKNR